MSCIRPPMSNNKAGFLASLARSASTPAPCRAFANPSKSRRFRLTSAVISAGSSSTPGVSDLVPAGAASRPGIISRVAPSMSSHRGAAHGEPLLRCRRRQLLNFLVLVHDGARRAPNDVRRRIDDGVHQVLDRGVGFTILRTIAGARCRSDGCSVLPGGNEQDEGGKSQRRRAQCRNSPSHLAGSSHERGPSCYQSARAHGRAPHPTCHGPVLSVSKEPGCPAAARLPRRSISEGGSARRMNRHQRYRRQSNAEFPSPPAGRGPKRTSPGISTSRFGYPVLLAPAPGRREAGLREPTSMPPTRVGDTDRLFDRL